MELERKKERCGIFHKLTNLVVDTCRGIFGESIRILRAPFLKKAISFLGIGAIFHKLINLVVDICGGIFGESIRILKAPFLKKAISFLGIGAIFLTIFGYIITAFVYEPAQNCISNIKNYNRMEKDLKSKTDIVIDSKNRDKIISLINELDGIEKEASLRSEDTCCREKYAKLDAAVYEKMGDLSNALYSMSEDDTYIDNSIKYYTKSLDLFNKNQDLLETIELNNKLGKLYIDLSQERSIKNNLIKARDYFLAVRTLCNNNKKELVKNNERMYFESCFNYLNCIGVVYGNMYLISGDEADIQRARDYFNDAKLLLSSSSGLLKTDTDLYSLYSILYNNIGCVYLTVYESEQHDDDKIIRLEEALNSFRKALDYTILENDEYGYALTSLNIGIVFTYLYKIEKTESYLISALAYYNKALKIWDTDHHQSENIWVNDAIGELYLYSYDKGKDKNILKTAREYFAKSSCLWKERNLPYCRDYAVFKITNGEFKIRRAEAENESIYLDEARDDCYDALDILTPALYPTSYISAKLELGKIYSRKYSYSAEKDDLRLSVYSFWDSMSIYNSEKYRFFSESDFRDTISSCDKYIQAFGNSAVQDYIIANYTEGLSYIYLYGITRKESDLDSAMICLRRSLEYYENNEKSDIGNFELSRINELLGDTCYQLFIVCPDSQKKEYAKKTYICYMKAYRFYKDNNLPSYSEDIDTKLRNSKHLYTNL